MASYRILERRNDSEWVPFGVAYERAGRLVLFAPPWRADRELDAVSLDALGERHVPSAEFRWQPEMVITGPLPHPIDLLQQALKAQTPTAQSAQVSIRARLVRALNHLMAERPEFSSGLQAWGRELARGTAACAEAVLRTVLEPRQGGTIDVLPEFSHGSLDFIYDRADFRGKSGQPADQALADEPSGYSSVVLTTNEITGVKVAVEQDKITATFLDWPGPSPPLMVLVPDAEGGLPQLPELIREADGNWRAQFTHLSVGKYLLAVAPFSASGKQP
jgi:hypothetical protein